MSYWKKTILQKYFWKIFARCSLLKPHTKKKQTDECAKCFLCLLFSFACYESTVVLRCPLLVEEVSSGASNAASLQAWTVLYATVVQLSLSCTWSLWLCREEIFSLAGCTFENLSKLHMQHWLPVLLSTLQRFGGVLLLFKVQHGFNCSPEWKPSFFWWRSQKSQSLFTHCVLLVILLCCMSLPSAISFPCFGVLAWLTTAHGSCSMSWVTTGAFFQHFPSLLYISELEEAKLHIVFEVWERNRIM